MAKQKESKSLEKLKKFLEEAAPDIKGVVANKIGVRPDHETLNFIRETPGIFWKVVGTDHKGASIFSQEIMFV